MTEQNNLFGCSICLIEVPRSPVLTRCGHLFCWPCIYRWAFSKRSCPICKGFLSHNCDFTPIYSSSQNDDDTSSAQEDGAVRIPLRPHAHRKSEQALNCCLLNVQQDDIPEIILFLLAKWDLSTTIDITSSSLQHASSEALPAPFEAPVRTSAQESPTSSSAMRRNSRLRTTQARPALRPQRNTHIHPRTPQDATTFSAASLRRQSGTHIHSRIPQDAPTSSATDLRHQSNTHIHSRTAQGAPASPASMRRQSDARIRSVTAQAPPTSVNLTSTPHSGSRPRAQWR